MIKKKDLDQDNTKAWEEYIKNPSDIYDKDKKYSKENYRKERFKYDLHGYTLDDANSKVREIILSCKENNYREILLITGKGLHSKNEKDIYVSKNLGTLRYSVPAFIKSEEELTNSIVSINEADIKDGGAGAILIKLKNL
ncbi:MAG: Smr/MutS family protein [Pseudomonadota bacterium]|nr:Smr/MutS family protein [Pseudomonadota bacterium]